MAEEKINVLYKGEFLEATKNKYGYTLDLPSPDGLKRTLYSTENGWQFDENSTEHSDSYFWMRMNNDGSVEYANDMTPAAQTIEKHYYPDFSDLGHLNNLGREMYGLIQQLEGYEKLGVSPADVLDLRRKIMELTIVKMLGYKEVNSVFYTESNPDNSIMDLDHAIRYIERYPAFAQYVSRIRYTGLETVMVNTPEDFSKEEFRIEFEKAKNDYENESAYVDDRLFEIERRRHDMLLPDFCKGMKSFLQKRGGQKRGEPTSWDEYSDTTRKLAKLILGFNADLLSAQEKMRVVQATSLNQVELLHQISLITEPAEMDEVLAEESYFFLEEAKRFSAKMMEDTSPKRVVDSTVAKLMLELAGETLEEAEDRKRAIVTRDYLRNVYPYEKDPEARKKGLNMCAGIKEDDTDRKADSTQKVDEGQEIGD